MTDILTGLLESYDDVTADVVSSNSSTFSTNLDRWFEVLDESPITAQVVQGLERSVDFQGWYEAAESSMSSMVGSAALRWPKGRENRIAMQLSLFRAIQQEKPDVVGFYMTFMGSSSRYDDMVFEVTDQIFSALARDLRYMIVDALERRAGDADLIPPSDRIVSLDHNTTEYAEAVKALEDAERTVQETNDYDDAEDKEQRIAELSAGRRLLMAARVRANAFIALVYKALRYLAEKFADHAIGVAATGALALLGKATGLW
jgi:hypothetical protein